MTALKPSKEVAPANIENDVHGGTVEFRNDSKYLFESKHLEIVRGLVRSVLSSLNIEDSHIVVELGQARLMGQNAAGEARRLGANKFEITLKGAELKSLLDDDGSVQRLRLVSFASTVAHELVHCFQYKNRWLEESKQGTLWKGQLQDDRGRLFDNLRYRDQPWEVMAFAAEKNLGKSAIEDLIGQKIISVSEGLHRPAARRVDQDVAADADLGQFQNVEPQAARRAPRMR